MIDQRLYDSPAARVHQVMALLHPSEGEPLITEDEARELLNGFADDPFFPMFSFWSPEAWGGDK